MGSSPVLWGPNNTSNNLQNQVLLANGELLANNGPRNYITYGNFENGLTTGWSLSHTTLSSNIPNQASGSWTSANANLSTAIVSSGQLSGTYSLSLASSSATTAGDMLVSQAYTLNIQDQGKVLTGTFYYSAVTNSSNNNFSNSVSNTWQPYIYDVTNSAWIQPIGVYGINQGTGVGLSNIQWQVPSNCTSFRFAIVCINASAGATTLYFDNFFMGPSPYVYGSPITDWQSFTMTIGGTTSAPTRGTVTSEKAYWRRNGKNMEIMYSLQMSAAGSVGSGAYLWTLPSGYTVDTTQATISTGITATAFGTVGSMVGTGTYATTSAGNTAYAGVLNAFLYSSTQLYFTSNTAIAGPYSVMYPVGSSNTIFSSAANFTFQISVPILGWSSSVQMSDSADTRVVDFVGYVSSNQALTTNVTNLSLTTVKDSNGAWTGATYVVPVPGDYDISTALLASSGSGNIQVWVNAVQQKQVQSTVTTAWNSGATNIPNLKAGDIISFRADNGFTVLGSTLSSVTIKRLSGPTTIGATDTVGAFYYASANTTGTSSAPFNFDTKVYDYTGSVTTGAAWKFTAPVAGLYSLVLYTNGTGSPDYLRLYKNGSFYCSLGYGPVNSISTLPCNIKLNAGDYIDFRAATSLTINGGSLAANVTGWCTINKIGI